MTILLFGCLDAPKKWRKKGGCKFEWGKERKLGLGVKGKPSIELTTRSSSGLSIYAKFDSGGLKFTTGSGGVLNKLFGELTKPVLKLVVRVLNTIALGMSFVVIPVEFQLPGQRTKLKFSKFAIEQYEHPNAPKGPQNNFALCSTYVTPKT